MDFLAFSSSSCSRPFKNDNAAGLAECQWKLSRSEMSEQDETHCGKYRRRVDIKDGAEENKSVRIPTGVIFGSL